MGEKQISLGWVLHCVEVVKITDISEESVVTFLRVEVAAKWCFAHTNECSTFMNCDWSRLLQHSVTSKDSTMNTNQHENKSHNPCCSTIF